MPTHTRSLCCTHIPYRIIEYVFFHIQYVKLNGLRFYGRLSGSMTCLQSLRRNSGECSPRDALPLLPENQLGNSPSLLQRNGRESPQEGAVLLLLLPKSSFSQEGERRGEDFGTEGTLSIGPFQQGEWAGLLLPQKDWPDRNIGGGVPPFPPSIEWRGFSMTSPKNGAGRLLFHAFLSLPLFPS